MKRSGAVARVLTAMLCVTALAACRDNGLPDRNLPLQEARNREGAYPVYQTTPTAAPVALGGRHWLRTGTVETVPARLLVQVGTAEGTLLFARRGEEAPYSRLYAPVAADQWIPYVRLN